MGILFHPSSFILHPSLLHFFPFVFPFGCGGSTGPASSGKSITLAPALTVALSCPLCSRYLYGTFSGTSGFGVLVVGSPGIYVEMLTVCSPITAPSIGRPRASDHSRLYFPSAS